MVNAFIADLGRTDYLETLELQRELVEMRKTGRLNQDVVLLAEHHPAILFGKEKSKFSAEFLKRTEESGKTHSEYLGALGIKFHDVKKGAASYVGPGQLMVYPITNYTRLVKLNDHAGYRNLLDATMLQVMHEFGIENAYSAGGFKPETRLTRRGIWHDFDGKSHRIGAKNLSIQNDMASRGFKLHVSAESLKHFWIVDADNVISMEHVLGYEPLMDHVKESVKLALKKNFKYDRLEPCQIVKDAEKLSIVKG